MKKEKVKIILRFDPRRDDNFKAMQKLRGEICAITQNAILEI